MPWRECSVMEERLRFVARLLDGDGMSDVCRQFGISRKTGYKIWGRYRQEGVEVLCDRSRRPVCYANQLPEQMERLIVETKRGNPQQNGRHERMHRTLKQETARPPGMNALQQQDRFDRFVSEFNDERPHEAIGMKTPAELYIPSSRTYEGLPEWITPSTTAISSSPPAGASA